jgi:hypothetical protein
MRGRDIWKPGRANGNFGFLRPTINSASSAGLPARDDIPEDTRDPWPSDGIVHPDRATIPARILPRP